MSILKVNKGKESLEIEFSGSKDLSSLLQHSGILIPQPCAGNGSCGKCRIKIKGEVSQPTTAEKKLLQGELDDNIRLSCQLQALGDCELELSDSLSGTQISTDTNGISLIYDGANPSSYGLAVDIGTTTVVCYLYHFADNSLVTTASAMNDQATFGSDVIARIEYSNKNTPAALQTVIVAQLNKLFAQCFEDSGILPSQISRVVITGNTVMLHLLTGKDPNGIGIAPFTPESFFGYSEKAEQLFPALAGANLYLPRCISAYVGADITCGALATNIIDIDKNYLLVDVGTNGELVLATPSGLKSCSTAAGPAFEGREVYMGMPASAGAINDVSHINGEILYTTIGDKPAVGICGTGIISCIGTLLELGIIDETGALDIEAKGYSHLFTEINNQDAIKIGSSEIILTQKDIRKIQLAKAAISSGIEALLHLDGISSEDIEKTFLCGGFGNYIAPKDAVAIGLLPKALLHTITASGNTAGIGASMLLFSEKLEEVSSKHAQDCVNLELSTDPYFMERYIENMMF